MERWERGGETSSRESVVKSEPIQCTQIFECGVPCSEANVFVNVLDSQSLYLCLLQPTDSSSDLPQHVEAIREFTGGPSTGEGAYDDVGDDDDDIGSDEDEDDDATLNSQHGPPMGGDTYSRPYGGNPRVHNPALHGGNPRVHNPALLRRGPGSEGHPYAYKNEAPATEGHPYAVSTQVNKASTKTQQCCAKLCLTQPYYFIF